MPEKDTDNDTGNNAANEAPLNREQRRHPDKNDPARSEQPPSDSYAGRADQDVTENTGAGAGGATEYGGGNKNHPSRIASSTPAGQKR